MAEKAEIPAHIRRLDKAADALLKKVENDLTSDAQKGRLFSQALAYYKVRESLMPSGEGNKLKEMGDGLKTESGRRDGSAGPATSTAGGVDPATDGAAIKALISKLPSFADAAGRDQARTKRKNGGAAGDDRSVPAHDGGNGAGNVDVAGDLRVLRSADFRTDRTDRLQSA